MKTESMMDGVDYTEVVVKTEDTEERVERQTICKISRDEKDILSNIKEEEEENGWERQSGEMESEDGVRDDDDDVKQLWMKQEKESDKQRERGETDQNPQTDREIKNKGESDCIKQEGDGLSPLITSCLLKQPKVLISRLEIGMSVPGPSILHSEVSLQSQNTGQINEAPSQVFACSQCPFVHVEEVTVHQHIEKVHPEEYSSILRSGRNGTESPLPPSSVAQSHTGAAGELTCSLCRKTFISQHRLTRHLQYHALVPRYHCPQCDKMLLSQSALRRHQRTHAKDRPYHCPQCEKRFTTGSAMKRHQKAHTRECPSPKPICEVGELERLYHCSHCGKTFKFKSLLTVHQRIHTGVRIPAPCVGRASDL
ncbi:hypothetical protein AAFF_G00201420 [Aldrovandia affinis]|uniref:C2H2-type domain-containing protein n=1 Tax=Aldrovandia affinis TaxID=143900 RepID=A0AAD7SWR6_9TELE|nr:hypothetical protein AAFF_G00201420 [Aldrovandia affinis]